MNEQERTPAEDRERTDQEIEEPTDEEIEAALVRSLEHALAYARGEAAARTRVYERTPDSLELVSDQVTTDPARRTAEAPAGRSADPSTAVREP